MFRNVAVLLVLFFSLGVLGFWYRADSQDVRPENRQTEKPDSYWMVLHRKSNREELLLGDPGIREKSKVVKTFKVKSGVPGQKPTPLPALLGKDYWLLINKEESFDNPETSPYFLQLDTPSTAEWPYGPVPYEECIDPQTGENIQCDWILPGYFGLHGSGGNPQKLSNEDPGSSGCVRHFDEDITYLYNTLDPQKEPIRYYIEDN